MSIIDEMEGVLGDRLREARERNRAMDAKYGAEEAQRIRERRWRQHEADEEKREAKERAMRALEKSGLQDEVRRFRFDNFTVNEDWQKRMLDKCKRFIEQDKAKFLYMSGQPGCGKTHLGTAVCGQLIERGLSTCYAMFDLMVDELRIHQNDDEYDELFQKYVNPSVLYIDDFMKFEPTKSDIKHPFKVINQRMIQRKITVITSEKSLADIIRIDDALGSRIKQMCGEFTLDVARKEGRNWRLKG